MDNKKVEQVLKEIFDRCGTEVVQNRKKFMGAVFDLLDEWNYKDERTVLKLAMESNAIPILLSASPVTSDSAERAVEQIRKDMHMDSADAKFVVQCVVAACGYNLDIVTENEKRRQAEEAERIRKEKEQRRQEEEKKQREEEQRQQEEERKRREEQRQHEEEKTIMYSVSCRYHKKGTFGSRKAMVQLCQQELKLISMEDKHEVSMKDFLYCKTDVISTIVEMIFVGCFFAYSYFAYFYVGRQTLWMSILWLIGMDVAYYNSIAMGIAGVIIILLINLATGFPLIIQHGEDTYYLITGSVEKQHRVKQNLIKSLPLMQVQYSKITEDFIFSVLSVLVYGTLTVCVLSDASWYEEPTVVLTAVVILLGIFYMFYFRHRTHSDEDINKKHYVFGGVIMVLSIILFPYSSGTIYEILLMRILPAGLQFLIILILRFIYVQVLDGIATLRQNS